MDTNCFDILSNEVILNIIADLDAVSLVHFCGCSSRLHEFSHISEDRWRKLYSIQWMVEEEELCLYRYKDWQSDFKNRYIYEKNLLKKPANECDTYEIQLRDLLTAVTAADLITALEKIANGTRTGLPGKFVATALLKLARGNEMPYDKAANLLEAFYKIMALEESTYGAFSVIEAFLDLKYNNDTWREAISLFNHYATDSNFGLGTEVRYLTLENRLLDFIERCPAMDLSLRVLGGFFFEVDISNRAGLCRKICQAIDQCVDPSSKLLQKDDCLISIKDFLVRMVPNNYEFLVAQGVLQKLFDSVPKTTPHNFYFIMTAIEAFAYERTLTERFIDDQSQSSARSYADKFYYHIWNIVNVIMPNIEPVSKKIARDEVLMNFVLDHAKKLRANASSSDELTIFDGVFAFFYALMYCRNVDVLFNSPYLDYVLPYIGEDIGSSLFSLACSLLSQYIRCGIETLRLNSIYNRLQPHLQSIISSSYFKHSITVWQTFYCGMKLDLALAKSLIERIIPELPFETDKKVSRSYAELLANMVQVDRTPFLDIDMKQLYDYYSKQLIIDDRSNDTSTRSKVPFSCNFIAAGASVPQFAELAVKDEVLLEKMYSLYNEEKEAYETIYLVVNFFSYVFRIPGWDNSKGLQLLERWGATMPLNAQMYYMFTMIDSFVHLFDRENPVQVLLFGTWIIARMSQRKDGRDGLKKLSSDIIEWLSSHSDPRIRKNMDYYQQNIHRAQMGYIDEI